MRGGIGGGDEDGEVEKKGAWRAGWVDDEEGAEVRG